jgi:hypothetical protein
MIFVSAIAYRPTPLPLKVVYVFMSAAVHLNVIKSFCDPGTDLLVDEDHLFCRVIPGLV